MRVEVTDVVGVVGVVEVGAIVSTSLETSRAVDAGTATVRAARLVRRIASFMWIIIVRRF